MELWGEDPKIPAIKHSRVQELNPTNKHIFLSNEREKKEEKRGKKSTWICFPLAFIPASPGSRQGTPWIRVDQEFSPQHPGLVFPLHPLVQLREWHWRIQRLKFHQSQAPSSLWDSHRTWNQASPNHDVFPNIISGEGAGLPKPQLEQLFQF